MVVDLLKSDLLTTFPTSPIISRHINTHMKAVVLQKLELPTMASTIQHCAETGRVRADFTRIEDEEDEEDLFEIDLDVVNNFPPPHYWESYITATNNALLANCLLPISDLSRAVPMVSKPCDVSFTFPVTPNAVFFVAESMPGKLLGFSSPGALSMILN